MSMGRLIDAISKGNGFSQEEIAEIRGKLERIRDNKEAGFCNQKYSEKIIKLLCQLFIWRDTKEGYNYWADLDYKIACTLETKPN